MAYYESSSPRLVALVKRLAPKGKEGAVLAALKRSQAAPASTVPDDSAAVARFIVACNERRLRGCPPPEPTNETAAFIVDTIAKLKVRI